MTVIIMSLVLLFLKSSSDSGKKFTFTISDFAGSGADGLVYDSLLSSQFKSPTGLALSNGEIYILANNILSRSRGQSLEYFAGALVGGQEGLVNGNYTEARFNSIDKICVMDSGTVIIVDSGNNCLRFG